MGKDDCVEEQGTQMLDVPVVYIAYNRPHHTRRTFSAIRQQRPGKLFIICDGPRPDRKEDSGRCSEVREILNEVDWPCEVIRNYADANVGLKRRVSSGLNWVFEQTDQAIVLEDDCLPHTDFFSFCAAMLERYKADEQVWAITGNNFQGGRRRGNASYYFSKYPHCWGWATWRRSWRRYEGDLQFWPEWAISKDWCHKVPDRVERRYWSRIFEGVRHHEFDSWSYAWLACAWYHGGLTATPNVNLVTNIGFGPDGTHTLSDVEQEGIPTTPIGALTHPDKVRRNTSADRFVFDHVFGGNEQRLSKRIAKIPRQIANKFAKLASGK